MTIRERHIDGEASLLMHSRECLQPRCAKRRYRSLRENMAVVFLRCLGILLVVSAIFKFSAADESIVLFVPRGLRSIAFGTLLVFEVVFGSVLILLARRHVRLLSRVSVVLLAGFAIVNVVKAAFLHETTCGCLGSIEMHPRTMAGLDSIGVVAFVLLARSHVPGALRMGSHCMAAAIAAWFPLDWYFEASEGEQSATAIDLDSWVGRRFPPLDSLSNRALIERGDWVIMLYDPACPSCRGEVREFAELQRAEGRYQPLIVIVGVQDVALSVNIPTARLRSRERVPTPSYLLLRDGVVLAAVDRLASLLGGDDTRRPLVGLGTKGSSDSFGSSH